MFKRKVILKKTPRCKLIPKADLTEIMPFSSHHLILNRNNQIGIEFNNDLRIRINDVITTDADSFNAMMDDLVQVALARGLTTLYFGGDLSDDLLKMFLDYGFKDVKVWPDSINQHLRLIIMRKDEL